MSFPKNRLNKKCKKKNRCHRHGSCSHVLELISMYLIITSSMGQREYLHLTEFPCEDQPIRFAEPFEIFDAGEYLIKSTPRAWINLLLLPMVAGKKALKHSQDPLQLDALNRNKYGTLLVPEFAA